MGGDDEVVEVVANVIEPVCPEEAPEVDLMEPDCPAVATEVRDLAAPVHTYPFMPVSVDYSGQFRLQSNFQNQMRLLQSYLPPLPLHQRGAWLMSGLAALHSHA